MVPITGGKIGELLAHPLSITSSSAAAAIEHGQLLFVDIDVLLLSFGMGGLHREHALQVFERGQRTEGVLGLTVELFVGDRLLCLGHLGPHLEYLRTLNARHAQRSNEPDAEQPQQWRSEIGRHHHLHQRANIAQVIGFM